MSSGKRIEPFRKYDVEQEYWVSEFIPWLQDVGFDPRNQECIDTIFWWWYVNHKLPELEKENA